MTTFGNHTFFGDIQPGPGALPILQFSQVPQQLLTLVSIALRTLAISAYAIRLGRIGSESIRFR